MSSPIDRLPPDVINALEQGHTIEAIKRLREHLHLGLAEAKGLVDAYKRAKQAPAAFREAHATHPVDDAGRVLPADALAALARGDTIGAIKILRERTGVGLAEAKKRIDAAHAGGGHVFTATDESNQPRLQTPPPLERSGLGQGEVQQSNTAFWAVLVLLAALLLYYVLGRT